MAKIEAHLNGTFADILADIDKAINKSVSASMEDSSSFVFGSEERCEVRVWERFSWSGNNRVSLSLTLVGTDGSIMASAITSGGSQAVFFKLNTFGEESFLNSVSWVFEKYGA